MSYQIAIIGAGVSGLTAAIHLESLGYSVHIYDQNTHIGGRLQSVAFDGYTLDVGFQVLLEEYPMVKKYLDVAALEMQYFESGAYIFNNQKSYVLGNFLNNPSLLWKTVIADIATLTDKIKILKLANRLKNTSIDTIFQSPEMTTRDYLRFYGFSESIIDHFFRPFFSGVFLDTQLDTSSRQFEFTLKMFYEGKVGIPKKGIQEVALQLASKLKSSSVNLGKKVQQIQGNNISFENDQMEHADYIIVTSNIDRMLPNLGESTIKWSGTENLYFTVSPEYVFDKKLIGLVSSKSGAIINSICFPDTYKANEQQLSLLSVSIVKKHDFTDYQLIQHVKRELKEHFNIEVTKYLTTFQVSKALPEFFNLQNNYDPSECQITENIFLAGDTMLNPSLNAAMRSGELAAQAIHQKITGIVGL